MFSCFHPGKEILNGVSFFWNDSTAFQFVLTAEKYNLVGKPNKLRCKLIKTLLGFKRI